MASLYVPPPSIEDLVAYNTEWLARNLNAKVTVTVWQSENKHYTTEYDATQLNRSNHE